MMTLFTIILSLAVKGSLSIGFVITLHALWGKSISPKTQKNLLLLCFLIGMIPLHLLWKWTPPTPTFTKAISTFYSPLSPQTIESPIPPSDSPFLRPQTPIPWKTILFSLWITGTFIGLFKFIYETWKASRKFGILPQSTRSSILEELEESKSIAGTFVPVGVIETDHIQTPAILGWLRPRILLPLTFASQWSSEERKWIFLHELAHFRSADAIGSTIARLALTLHWWNPLFHVAARAYRHLIEEAADESVTQTIPPSSSDAYASLLLKLSTNQPSSPQPIGALGIHENYQTLKRRIEMILKPRNNRASILNPLLMTLSLAVFIGLALFSWGEDQDAQTSAAALAAQSWLKVMDDGKYS